MFLDTAWRSRVADTVTIPSCTWEILQWVWECPCAVGTCVLVRRWACKQQMCTGILMLSPRL